MAAGFNWRRGLGPSLVLIAGTIGYAAWIGRGIRGTQATRFWAVIGLLVLGELLLAFATTWLAQKGREGLSRLISGAVTFAVLGGAWWYAQRTSAAFTNEERAPLLLVEEHGEPRLRHPALGFSILHPGPGFVLTASQAYRADAQFYAFTDKAGAESLTVGLFKGVGDSSASLRDLIEEMGKQAGALGGKGGGARPCRSLAGARHRSASRGVPRDHRRRPPLPDARVRLASAGAVADRGPDRGHVT